MNKIEAINTIINSDKELDTNLISDGYHTFGELYDHRIELYIKLLKTIYKLEQESTREKDRLKIWKAKYHSDGTYIKDWFLLGAAKGKGHQITYHLPISRWDECYFAEELLSAPEYDGHTSKDVLERIKKFL